MTIVVGLLSILLGLVLWLLAGLLPVIRLWRIPGAGVKVSLDTTWMGVITLVSRTASHVQGARLIRDPGNEHRVRVEIAVPEGWTALTPRPFGSDAPRARVAQIIDRFAKEARIPPTTLPLMSRLNLMLRFALLFPLGTVSMFIGALTIARVL